MTQRSSKKVSQPPASELRPLTELQKELEHLFPSLESLRWELRQQRELYVQAGAIFEIGRKIFAHPETFRRVALEIGARRIAGRTGARA